MESKSTNVAIIVVIVAFVGVVALGVISAVAIYGVKKYVTTAKDAEGRKALIGWSDGIAECAARRGGLPPSSPAVPPALTDVAGKKYVSAPSDWADPAFSCAGFSLTAPQHHQYQWVRVTERAGVARTIGDYNGDGTPDSVLELEVICTGGSCQRGAAVTETHPAAGTSATTLATGSSAPAAPSQTRYLVLGIVVMVMTLLSAAVGIWQLIVAFRVSLGWGLIVMFVPCGALVFVLKHWELAKKPFLAQLGLAFVFVVTMFLAGAMEAVLAPRAAAAAAVPSTPATATLPAPTAAPERPPVPIPVLKGAPAELNTVMGRARALANDWQPEAALLGIEAKGVVAGQIQTENGGIATLTFGPSKFDTTTVRTGYFVVTYDKTGLRSEAQATVAGKPTEALPEPMCAPEDVYTQATGGEHTVVTLRYAFDASKRAAWLVTSDATPAAKPRGFDSQTCGPLQELRR